MNNYEVYVAKSKDGMVLYVGQGKVDRHKHLSSGVSHVYEANRWHHNNKFFSTEVVALMETKKEAEEVEDRLIAELRPCWNKVSPYRGDWREKYKFVKKRLRDGIRNKELKAIRKDKKDDYMKVIKKFLMLSNNSDSFILLQGQTLDGLGLPSGFYSRICDMSGDYYPHLRYLFEASHDKGNRCYTFKIKGWQEYLDQKQSTT